MRRILILGGGGFIGSHLARTLLSDPENHITIADKSLKRLADIRESATLRLIEDDFAEELAYGRLDDHYDQVYLLAAIVGVNNTLRQPEEVIRVNTALVHYTLRWLKTANVGRMVFTSSSENYAGTTDAFGYSIPTDEKVPLCIQDIKHPRFTYAVTKILGESAFLTSSAALGYEVSVVRYQNIFGPNMGFRHAIPHIIQRFVQHKDGEVFKIYGASQTRAFCFVEDAVSGTMLAMNTSRAKGEIYHIGNEKEITLRELTTTIGDLVGYSGRYEDAETYPGSVERRCPDISKSRQELGFDPKVDWKTGLVATVKWYSDFFLSNQPLGDHGFEPPENFRVRSS